MYRVEVKNSGDSTFHVRSKDYEFIIDTKGKGITPPDTLLASLGSCIGVYIRKYIEGAKLPLGEFSTIIEAEFDKEKPVSFKIINVSIDLKGMQLDEKRKKALLSFVKNCPVHNTLKIAPSVEVKIM